MEDDGAKPAVPTDEGFVNELNYLLTISKHPRTVQLLQNALECEKCTPPIVKNGDGKSHQTCVSGTDSRPSEATGKISGHAVTGRIATKIKEYGWDQSETHVKIYITTIPGLDQISTENVIKEFTKKSLKVELIGVQGKNYGLVVNDLCGNIVPDQSFVKVKNGNVTICLRKKEKENWLFLTGREKKLKEARETKPPKMDKDEDPGVGLMKLMKQMYNDGDDEMKRTIAKAWHESQEKRAKGIDDLS